MPKLHLQIDVNISDVLTIKVHLSEYKFGHCSKLLYCQSYLSSYKGDLYVKFIAATGKVFKLLGVSFISRLF